jgi:MFS family permease
MSGSEPVTILERSARKVASMRSGRPGGVGVPVSTILRSRQAAPVVAVVLGVLTLGFCLAAVPLDGVIHQNGPGGPVADWLSTATVVVPVIVVGVLLAARRPRNPIGWILLAILVIGFNPLSQYAVLDYRMHHGTLPFGWVAVVFGSDWPMLLVLIAILLWVFPDGRLPPGRWRRVSAALVAAGLLVGLVGLAPGIVDVAGHDVHLEASGNLSAPSSAWEIAGFMTIIAVLASWLGWLVVQVPRYRYSSGERRQQLKWLYSGATAFLALLCLSLFVVPLALGDSPGSGPPVLGDLFNLGIAVLPVCIGVAVLKYRLFAIDRVISRVISYAIITVVLAGVFAGLVLLATDVLPFKTPVAVAAATLAAAALFNPLRRRVQRAVDRRFNRTRYNAEAVVAAFTAGLRQTVDLDTVQGDLVGAVHQAFEPAHVSVWLAAGTSAEPSQPGR